MSMRLDTVPLENRFVRLEPLTAGLEGEMRSQPAILHESRPLNHSTGTEQSTRRSHISSWW